MRTSIIICNLKGAKCREGHTGIKETPKETSVAADLKQIRQSSSTKYVAREGPSHESPGTMGTGCLGL